MFRRILLTAALLAGTAGSAGAQGWIEPMPRPDGRPGIARGQVVRVSSQVRTRLTGRVATVEVEEQFRNSGGWIAEGTYLYPLPGEAVFQNFSLWMGEQEVRGEMMNADQARGIYEEIVRRLRDPALLTLEGHGLIRARVFPIQPGETRRVVLRYTQLLPREGDALRLRYAIGLRSPIQPGALNTPPGAMADQFRYRLTVPDAETWGTPYSPTHRITTRSDGGDLVVTLDSTASGDVEIFLPLRRGLVGTSLTTHAPAGDQGYFLLLVSPAHEATGNALPRDLTLVVDVSGSMSGTKLDQAKTALRQALGTLSARDRFRLVAFSNGVRLFRDGFTAATEGNVAEARRWIETLQADGGTNIAGALEAALAPSVGEERLAIVVFLTDGLPTVGERTPERIAAEAGGRIGRSRVFTVGVGYDVNTYLLDRLAQEGRGTAQYVPPEGDVEQTIGGLMAKVRHPALTNVRIERAPVELVQSYPSRLPDVFFGEELVILGRYRGTGRGEIVITGERGGRTERFTAEAVFPAAGEENAFIPRLWASRRIGELTRQIRLEGASETLVREVRELGLRYGILTEYTSYLVQEPMTAVGGVARPADRSVAAPAPSAQSGAGAVAAARASASMMGAGNLAAADDAAKSRAEEMAARGLATRRVGGRLFVDRGGVWTDAAHRDSLRVVEVAPFSDAYFQLVRALPEIAPALQAGETVLVAGRRVSVKVTAGGMTAWPDGQLPAVVRAFRGA